MDIQTALQVYKELADWYERQGQAAMRDRFLILAAEAAFSAGKVEEAERLRQRLLQGNPHHMLKPFNSFAQALQSSNIQIYVHDLQVNYPPETAERLLQDLRSGASPSDAAADGGEHTLKTTPQQTTPIIAIHDESTLPLGSSPEPLKVYPLSDQPKRPASSAPPAKPTNLNRPAPRKAAPPAAVNPPPRPAPRSQPAPPRAAAPRPDLPPPPSEAAAPAGAWLTLFLFGMTVTAAIALAVYAFARPFLPW
jgi:hypothetical protein